MTSHSRTGDPCSLILIRYPRVYCKHSLHYKEKALRSTHTAYQCVKSVNRLVFVEVRQCVSSVEYCLNDVNVSKPLYRLKKLCKTML